MIPSIAPAVKTRCDAKPMVSRSVAQRVHTSPSPTTGLRITEHVLEKKHNTGHLFPRLGHRYFYPRVVFTKE